MKLLIDNGHGIDTPGKRSPDGRLFEYAYARRLAAALVAVLPESVLLVDEERDIPLAERTRRANAICQRYGATKVTLISIHVNAAGSGSQWMSASGWMALTSLNPSSESRRLAATLQRHAIAAGLAGNRALPSEGFWRQNLAICRDTLCPAVLTENLFQDNRNDVDYLLSDRGFETIVDIHLKSLKEYLQ